MSTLSDGTTTVTLDDGLAWADEFSWQPVAQSTRRTITGGLVVTQQVMTAGQPMTLAAEQDDKGWISRATLLQCLAWAGTPGQVLTLTYRGTAYTVLWRLEDGPIDAHPVMPWLDDQAQDDYRATLRFMRT